MGRHKLLDSKQQRNIICCVFAASDMIMFVMLFVEVHAICVCAVFVFCLSDCPL